MAAPRGCSTTRSKTARSIDQRCSAPAILDAPAHDRTVIGATCPSVAARMPRSRASCRRKRERARARHDDQPRGVVELAAASSIPSKCREIDDRDDSATQMDDAAYEQARRSARARSAASVPRSRRQLAAARRSGRAAGRRSSRWPRSHRQLRGRDRGHGSPRLQRSVDCMTSALSSPAPPLDRSRKHGLRTARARQPQVPRLGPSPKDPGPNAAWPRHPTTSMIAA